MKSSSVIDVTALRVEREAVILESIDWRVERGEHWAILGANGSGKTSLLRALTGYLPPTAGTIRVGGSTPHALVAEHRLGIAFQDHALLPWLSVFDNVALPFRVEIGRAHV